MGDGAAAPHELPDLVVRDIGGGRPEGEHVAAVDIVVERGQRRVPIVRLMLGRLRLAHVRLPSLARRPHGAAASGAVHYGARSLPATGQAGSDLTAAESHLEPYGNAAFLVSFCPDKTVRKHIR